MHEKYERPKPYDNTIQKLWPILKVGQISRSKILVLIERACHQEYETPISYHLIVMDNVETFEKKVKGQEVKKKFGTN